MTVDNFKLKEKTTRRDSRGSVGATKVNLGQNGRGSFIEFSVPKSQLVLPSFSIGTGNHGIINNGGAGYNLSGTNPRFVRFNWFDF